MGTRTIFSGVTFCDLFDIHPTSFARYGGDSLHSAIDDHTDIQLAVDFQGFLDEDCADWDSVGASLMRDEVGANEILGRRSSLVRIRDQLDAACLAAPASVNLRLYDDIPAKIGGDRRGLVRRVRHPSSRHGDTSLREYLLRLVFMNFQELRLRIGTILPQLTG